MNTKQYYRYPGSLTTPPCSEVITWTLFKDPMDISSQQVSCLAVSLPPHTHRHTHTHTFTTHTHIHGVGGRVEQEEFLKPLCPPLSLKQRGVGWGGWRWGGGGKGRREADPYCAAWYGLLSCPFQLTVSSSWSWGVYNSLKLGLPAACDLAIKLTILAFTVNRLEVLVNRWLVQSAICEIWKAVNCCFPLESTLLDWVVHSVCLCQCM